MSDSIYKNSTTNLSTKVVLINSSKSLIIILLHLDKNLLLLETLNNSENDLMLTHMLSAV